MLRDGTYETVPDISICNALVWILFSDKYVILIRESVLSYLYLSVQLDSLCLLLLSAA